MKTLLAGLYLLISLPAMAMSLFITHELLEAIHADRLLWFIYWLMVPMLVFMSLAGSILRKMTDDVS